MARVEIEDMVLPQKNAETSTTCSSCPSETKDKVDGTAGNVDDTMTRRRRYRPLASRELTCEDHCIALIALIVVGLVLLIIMAPRPPRTNDLITWHGKSTPIEALRCIRIHYIPVKGEYECINWDIKSVPLVGARRIVPDIVDGYDANKVELYTYGSNAEFAVYTPSEFKRISVIVQNGLRHGQGVMRYELIVSGPTYEQFDNTRPLDNELANRLITATVAVNAPQETKDEDKTRTWMQQLIKAMLTHSPSTNVAIGCEARRLELGEFRLPNPYVQPTNNILFVGDDIVHVSHKVYQALLDLSNNNAGLAEESYVLTGMTIKATIVTTPHRYAFNRHGFKLMLQLPVAKHCHRLN